MAYTAPNKNKIALYGIGWDRIKPLASIELEMIRRGGYWKQKNGEVTGRGLFYHMKRFQELVWPGHIWQKGPYKNYWSEKILECWIESKYLGICGCASAGKSDSLAAIALTDWYAWPDCTTTLVCSTTIPMLEMRIWGMIKKYHREAKAQHKWIPGHLTEGKLRIIQDAKMEFAEGRDFKNGICGIPIRVGNQYVGLQNFSGIHNKHVRVICDEGNLTPRGFLDASSNLSMCEDFKLVTPGNPNETTNAHGIICEPSEELGGWEGGIDQSPGTKTWKTRFPGGLCLQLPGSDSPNLKAPIGEPPPFPFLITREAIAENAKIWGTDDWHYAMMVDAKMPRGQGSHRVVTRQECEKFGATLEAFWRDSNIVRIASLDAAYRGAGGDRCVFTEINFGKEIEGDMSLRSGNVLSQNNNAPAGRQILALVDQTIIQIDAGLGAETPETQIRKACKQQCDNRGIPYGNFFYDAGMRTSLVQEFCNNWSNEVRSIDCGGSPTDQMVSSEIQKPCKDYYSKFVTELWFSVRLVIVSRQFRNLSQDVMWELCAREWKTVGANKIEVESKDEMKIKTSKSPDLADSLSIAVHGARQRGFVPARILPKPTRNGPDWRDKARELEKKAWAGQLEYAT